MENVENVENKDILRNDAESVKYRRNQNTLVVLGTGVMLFGFWGIIKIIAQLLLGAQFIDPEQMEELGPEGTIFVTFFVAAVLSTDVILRLYAGLRVRREGHGRKVGIGHLIISALLIIGSLFSIAVIIWSLISMYGDAGDNFVALFLELSSLVVTLEVFMASVSVRRYRKKLAKGVK